MKRDAEDGQDTDRRVHWPSDREAQLKELLERRDLSASGIASRPRRHEKRRDRKSPPHETDDHQPQAGTAGARQGARSLAGGKAYARCRMQRRR